MAAEGVEAFYDRFWSSEGAPLRSRHETHDFLRPARDWLLDRRSVRGKRCLEIGAGSGSDAAELLARGAKEVVLVDLSARCVEQLRERADGRWTALQADAEDLPFEDDSFDLVFASKLLMHTDAARVWRESARVLRPGGRACFVEPLQHHPAVVVWRRIAGGFTSVPHRFLSRREMSEAAGAFRQTEQRGFFFLSPLLYPSPVGQALDEKMLTRLPVLERWAWISALEGLV